MKGEVRIIGGQWRGRRLAFHDRPGLRPTPARGRETLFNWLGQSLAGWHCLDLFAGSGALGFEAASRGAAQVVLVEQDRLACVALRANAQRLGADGVTVRQVQAHAWLETDPATYDLIFLDPPFGSDEMGRVWSALSAHLRPGGWIYCESSRGMSESDLWREVRCTKVGQARLQLFQRR
ncbi:16S rRNA (guanine(966)-N(2))-methyltransferase RsmD [Ferrovum sp.]|jgi:16S rRNA (guanine(966)-N(2))-methyltransferase RsmD|uniref:16S rRNA (guanine(966)-N(2))-methyltransferase RsmD n=1 Tax=Ferrovum sp. TaxID=2609467 RepID=UPI00262227AC|nr:16S rRNA (guanine(966)-N(2))-methyltransferase RsmD [Ferrovum sp.]